MKRLSNWKVNILKSNTPSVLKYKQKSFFRFIHLMMYVVHIMDHVHHQINEPKKWFLFIFWNGESNVKTYSYKFNHGYFVSYAYHYKYVLIMINFVFYIFFLNINSSNVVDIAFFFRQKASKWKSICLPIDRLNIKSYNWDINLIQWTKQNRKKNIKATPKIL